MTMTEAIDVKAYLEDRARFVDNLLDQFLPSSDAEPRMLHEAMRYSVMAGGKRLRPILAGAAFEYCGGSIESENAPICKAMAALELVHTYSLIHDDLPCMDDDDLRRGIPTCHKKYGEATAVLAGDALHDVAFELMAETGSVEVVKELAKAIGTSGMIGGQMADVEAEGQPVTKEQVVKIHRRKTGALMRCTVRVGAILAGADRDLFQKLSDYGEKIGLAFQLIDDILDISGDQELLGKDIGSDDKNRKATYPAAVGIKQARKDADQLISQAVELLESRNDNYLRALAIFVGQRQH